MHNYRKLRVLASSFFLGLFAQGQSLPSGIPGRLACDPIGMIEEAISDNRIAFRYVIEHPDGYREPLKKFVSRTDSPRELYGCVELAFSLLEPEEFTPVAEKALRSISFGESDLVREAKARIQEMIESKRRGLDKSAKLATTKNPGFTKLEVDGTITAVDANKYRRWYFYQKPIIIFATIAGIMLLAWKIARNCSKI
ncbi:MAG: hypothetical protein R3F31_25340 [Verrucomicrobiales bacterium]|nr:hypothetical protein [Verrucomicrobiales bacterium]